MKQKLIRREQFFLSPVEIDLIVHSVEFLKAQADGRGNDAARACIKFTRAKMDELLARFKKEQSA